MDIPISPISRYRAAGPNSAVLEASEAQPVPQFLEFPNKRPIPLRSARTPPRLVGGLGGIIYSKSGGRDVVGMATAKVPAVVASSLICFALGIGAGMGAMMYSG